MIIVGAKVRLKRTHYITHTPFGTKHIEVNPKQIYTVTHTHKSGDIAFGSCTPFLTGIHRIPEWEFEVVEESPLRPQFAFGDAVIIRPSADIQTRSKNRARMIDTIKAGVPTSATIVGMSLKLRDFAQIEYVVRINNGQVVAVETSDIELKDYTLF